MERIARRVQFWIAARLHPELKRIQSEEDRMWALWFASADPPGWQRYLSVFSVLLIGPVVVTITIFGIAETMELPWRRAWVLLFIAGWIGGFLVTAAIIELLRDRSLRSRYFMAMRIFGHDVCLGCGYEMTGHHGDPWLPRTCPECGAAVAPFEGPRDEPGRAASPRHPGPRGAATPTSGRVTDAGGAGRAS